MKNSQVLLTLAIGSVGFGGMFAVLGYLSPTLLEATQFISIGFPLHYSYMGLDHLLSSIIGGKLTDMNMKWAIAGSLGWAIIVLAVFPFSIYSLYTILPMAFCLGTTAMLVPALQVRLMDVAGGHKHAASLNHAAFNIANGLRLFWEVCR